jgi:hypothetical protein
MASTTPDQAIISDVFAAAVTGRTLAKGLIRVHVHHTHWLISIQPGQCATIKSAGGYAARFACTDATPAQDALLRNRMLIEFGGQW